MKEKIIQNLDLFLLRINMMQKRHINIPVIFFACISSLIIKYLIINDEIQAKKITGMLINFDIFEV